jgi:hypothetical protein
MRPCLQRDDYSKKGIVGCRKRSGRHLAVLADGGILALDRIARPKP